MIVISEEIKFKEKQNNRECTPLIDWTEAPKDIGSTPEHRGVTVFIDGSKIGGEIGADIAIFADGVLVEEHFYLLPLTLKCFIMKALELCSSEESYSLYRDSRSLLMSLSNPNTKDQLCVGIHEKRGEKEVGWYCVRVHVGTVGNETAD